MMNYDGGVMIEGGLLCNILNVCAVEGEGFVGVQQDIFCSQFDHRGGRLMLTLPGNALGV